MFVHDSKKLRGWLAQAKSLTRYSNTNTTKIIHILAQLHPMLALTPMVCHPCIHRNRVSKAGRCTAVYARFGLAMGPDTVLKDSTFRGMYLGWASYS
jgi:hypothetical protein